MANTNHRLPLDRTMRHRHVVIVGAFTPDGLPCRRQSARDRETDQRLTRVTQPSRPRRLVGCSALPCGGLKLNMPVEFTFPAFSGSKHPWSPSVKCFPLNYPRTIQRSTHDELRNMPIGTNHSPGVIDSPRPTSHATNLTHSARPTRPWAESSSITP